MAAQARVGVGAQQAVNEVAARGAHILWPLDAPLKDVVEDALYTHVRKARAQQCTYDSCSDTVDTTILFGVQSSRTVKQIGLEMQHSRAGVHREGGTS